MHLRAELNVAPGSMSNIMDNEVEIYYAPYFHISAPFRLIVQYTKTLNLSTWLLKLSHIVMQIMKQPFSNLVNTKLTIQSPANCQKSN